MPVTLTCKQCSSEYEVTPARSDDSSFCSKSCYSEWQSENLTGENNPSYKGGYTTTSICEWCGDEHQHREDKKGRFCSENCKNEWHSEYMSGENHPNWQGGKESVECEFCSSEYEAKKARADSSRFCSLDCLALWKSKNRNGPDSPNWSGGHQKDYGPMWNKIRDKIRGRDETCHICSMSREEHKDRYGREPDVHHIEPIESFDTFEQANDESNLVMLCRDCHAKVECGKREIESVEPAR